MKKLFSKISLQLYLVVIFLISFEGCTRSGTSNEIPATVTPNLFDLPTGWGIAGSQPKSYAMGIDKGAGQDGKNAATIKSIDKEINGFGTLMQDCLPGKYLGKRVKMSGFIKSKNVDGWAGFWFRVDQSGSQQSLAFDNMYDRAIRGTTDWKKYEIVLDVSSKASNLAYGVLLNGTGQVWFENLKFEVVDGSISSTDVKSKLIEPSEPTNLDFQK
jgi:hypothetical protein